MHWLGEVLTAVAGVAGCVATWLVGRKKRERALAAAAAQNTRASKVGGVLVQIARAKRRPSRLIIEHAGKALLGITDPPEEVR